MRMVAKSLRAPPNGLIPRHKMDLFADARKLVRAHLDHKKIDYSRTATLEQLLHLALKIELKSVRPVPRVVHRSAEFDAKLAALTSDLQSAAEIIMGKTARGEDLSGHLSKKSIKASQEDPLLTDWSFHHLHISVNKDSPTAPFFARTGPLMFVFFTKDAAHFTDIHPHGKATWTRVELLEIVSKTWPSVLEPSRLRGVVATAWTPLADDISELRKGRVNCSLMIGGNVIFSPGGGVMSSGLPIKVARATDAIMDGLQEMQDLLNSLDDGRRISLASEANVPGEALDFELLATSSGAWAVYVRGTTQEVFQIPIPLRV